MDAEAKLARAFAASGAPRRDPGFVLAVMQAAEARRYRRARSVGLLRAAALAASAAALAPALAGWISANAEAVQDGAVMAAAVGLAVAGLRMGLRRNVVRARA